MARIDTLLAALNERTIAQQIGIPHDEARMRYQLRSNTVADFDEFSQIIADYYQHHYTGCVAPGGSLSSSEAAGRAKELLEQAYRKRRGDIVSAFNDAHDGTNGGMRVVLDNTAEGLKAESLERYIRHAFDQHIAPNSWEQQVEIIRQFIAACGNFLAPSIVADQPERYARNYNDLIRSYVDGLQQTSSVFRRL